MRLDRLRVRLQDGVKIRREHDVAVLAPFALLDADHHPLGIDVADAQVGDLRDAQATRVHRHQQGSVLEVARRLEQGGHLLRAEDLRQLEAHLLVGNVADFPVALEHLAVEEPERADDLVEVGPRDPAVPGQVQLVLADVLEGELIRGPHEVADKVADAAYIAFAGARAVPSELELFVHAIVELAHDALLSG